MEGIPGGLLHAIADRYGVTGAVSELGAGITGSLWRLDGNPSVVVQLSRYAAENMRLSCRVAGAFARLISEAVAPLIGKDGQTVFLWDGQPVTVWPFVEGRLLDRDDPAEREQLRDSLDAYIKRLRFVRSEVESELTGLPISPSRHAHFQT